MTDSKQALYSTVNETRRWFNVENEPCLGIVHVPASASNRALLIVVGGPQYRVGSHRQFLMLARTVAMAGYTVMRFDYRGMGDSFGDTRDFAAVDADISIAIDELKRTSGVTRVVLWGLCDAASAGLIYNSHKDGLDGLILLNPWVHTAQGEAKARLKTYYVQRLFNRDLWAKIVRLQFDFSDSLKSLWAYWRRARAGTTKDMDSGQHFIDRMLQGLNRSSAPIYLILSGDDLTAPAFEQLRSTSPAWRVGLAARCRGELRIAAANHTFARADWREQVARQTVVWLRELDGQ